jgi:O-antigen/teichoic acid export membrane protein
VIRNIARIFGTRVWGSVCGLGLYMFLARRMGPELQGVVSFSVMLVGLLVMFACLGVDSSAVYFLNRIGVSARHYLRRVLPLLVLTTLAAAALMVALHGTGILGRQGSGDPWILLFIILLFPLDMLLNLLRFLFLARERIGDLNLIDQAQFVLLLLFVGIVLVFRPTSPALVMAAYLADRAVVAAWILWRTTRRPLDRDPTAGALPRAGEIMRYSVFPWIGNVLYVLGTRLDTIMVAWYATHSSAVTAADLGFYTICMMAMMRIQDMQFSIQNALWPRVASLPVDAARELAARYYRVTWLVFLLIFLAVAAAGAPVLSIFGKGYVTAFPILVILAFGYLLLRANAGVLAIYFTSIGRPDIPMWVNGAGTVVNLALNLALIPRLGILGAAAGSAGGCLAAKLLLAAFFTWRKGSYWQDLTLRRADLRDIRLWVEARLRDRSWLSWRVSRP